MTTTESKTTATQSQRSEAERRAFVRKAHAIRLRKAQLDTLRQIDSYHAPYSTLDARMRRSLASLNRRGLATGGPHPDDPRKIMATGLTDLGRCVLAHHGMLSLERKKEDVT